MTPEMDRVLSLTMHMLMTLQHSCPAHALAHAHAHARARMSLRLDLTYEYHDNSHLCPCPGLHFVLPLGSSAGKLI